MTEKKQTKATSERTEDSERELPPRFRIKQYEIVYPLQKGGMSTLYYAINVDTKQPIALKILSSKFLKRPEVTDRFLNEAKILKKASHPNIIQVYDYGKWEKGLFIAMEFIEGLSLRKQLQQVPLSLQRALKIIIDTAYTICHLHTLGIIHRDLKPENILLTRSGEVKLIDFGIAQHITENENRHAPLRRQLIGTPVYISPEQLKNASSVSYPSDIYSLGIITYELILGRPSFGNIYLGIMPKGVRAILHKALQPNPQTRYQDIVDFITDLSSYLHSSEIQEEQSAHDRVCVLAENLLETQSLIESTPSQWKGLSTGFACDTSQPYASPYQIFFSLADGSHAFLMTPPLETTSKTALSHAILYGTIQALATTSASSDQFLKHFLPLQREETRFCYLHFDFETSKINYTLHNFGSLWKGTKKKETFSLLSSLSSPVQSEQVESNTLLLFTSFLPENPPKNRYPTTSPQLLAENLLHNCPQAEKTPFQDPRALIVLSFPMSPSENR